MQTWADASEHNFLLCGALVDALALRGNGVSGQGSRQSTHRMVLNSRTYAGGHPRVRLLHNVPSFILITTAVPGELIYSTGHEEN